MAYLRALLALLLLALSACATVERALPQSRTYAAPMARVKPAMVSVLAGMGMRMTALESRGGREILKARKPGTDVVIELESVDRNATRVRVSTNSGGFLDDGDFSARIHRDAARRLGDA